MSKSTTAETATGPSLVDQKIAALNDWRGDMLSQIRKLINEVDPTVEEDCKWFKPTNPTGVPVWSNSGIICTGESYKAKVKLTFQKGAFLPDPSGLFNASLEGKQRRAIDIGEGETIDADTFKALIQAAIDLNNAPRK
ncbi:hypothetical protein OLMES_5186 [Oleiphilus messinensis]|uniref:YdhG-like domain-containing protein n=1 Tax=Oleiphilus messinensis TaxID=141451 RepID=A0A1Y0IG02_9GAMM|nr:DUF1801 domain-containing protein [Oleiphilus messinensis]ARU59170.1 hypothetical protein OLMES_5186 [Oleiphilus messinensis]